MVPDAGDGEPVYLKVVDALELYAVIIDATVEQAADHLRDRSGLEGALVRPRGYANYESADLALQAAVLAHGIAESQTFIDGSHSSGLSGWIASNRRAPLPHPRQHRQFPREPEHLA